MTFKVAFYRGRLPGIKGLYSRAVPWWTRTPYSHCEFVFSDGMSGSQSYVDGGVRLKYISYSSGNWDFIELPTEWESDVRSKFESKLGFKYDILGNFGFVWPDFNDLKDSYFCQEIIAKLLGIEQPHIYSPGMLYYTLKFAMSKLGNNNGNRN